MDSSLLFGEQAEGLTQGGNGGGQVDPDAGRLALGLEEGWPGIMKNSPFPF